MCPGVRVLVSLRSPVERCWSWYRFNRARLRLPEDLSFDAYLDRCEELHRAGVDGNLQHQPFWGLGGGCYDTWFDDVDFSSLESDPDEQEKLVQNVLASLVLHAAEDAP